MLSNMFAVKIWTFVTLFACMAYGQRKPPNYQNNEMPPTSFSCKDKIVGGYYADPETSCQMFHVCVNVVGSGLQDFRFLCPNDTAFDQENQICDDWYNIDCEAATLYYSDNFDLYKLGSRGAQAVTSGKATPIPLGPSSASPSVQPQQAKPRKQPPSLSVPVNNAVSENDDDYYLQRSDSSDSRLQHDLLRGSSSGNFFSNRNRGVENPDDYDDTRASSSKDVPKKNTKAAAPFRKLLTGKKPIAESSTGAPSTAAETVQWTTTTGTTTTVRQPNYKPTTYRSKDRGRVNYKTYLDKQAKADEYDYQKVAKPAAVTQAATVSSSFQTTTARANNNAYQTTQINIAHTNQPKNNDFLRIVPTNSNNGFHSTRINAVPSNNNNNNNNFQANNNNFQANNNNFQANSNNFQANNNNFQANNNNFQANNNAFAANNNAFAANNNAFAANNNNFQANNAFPANSNNNNNNNFPVNNVFPSNNNFQSNKVFQPANSANQNFQNNNINYNQGFVSDKIASTTVQNFKNQSPTTNSYQTNTFPQQQQQQQQQQGNNAFPQGNTFQSGNAFQPASNFQSRNAFQQPDNQFQNVVPTTQKYNEYQSSPTAYQQTTNVFQSPTPYNAANSFQQQTSHQPQFQSTTEHFSKDFKAKFDPYSSYHQRTNEEAGETLKTASSTNLRPSDLNALVQAKPKSINATLSVGFSFNKADGGVAKSTVVVPAAPTTQKPRPFTTQPTTVQQTTQTVTRTTAFAAPSTTKKAVTKDKDSSYDYAYYDDSNHNDYSDVVPEEFSRIQNAKKL